MILSDIRKSINREDLNKLILDDDVELIENISYEDSAGGSIFTSKEFTHIDFVNCRFKKLQAQHSIFEWCNFINCVLPDSNFSCGQFIKCGINNCDFQFSSFRGNWMLKTNIAHGKFSDCKFDKSSLEQVDFGNSDVDHCDFQHSIIKKTNFNFSNLSNSLFTNCDFSDVDFNQSQMSGVNFSQSKGLMNPIDYLIENFEWINNGIIVYKMFDFHYRSPWGDLKPGMIISEEVNYDRTLHCACGVNASNKKHFMTQFKKINTDKKVGITIWKCIIKFPWLSGVVVPYNTTGNIRCSRLQLVNHIDKRRIFEI